MCAVCPAGLLGRTRCYGADASVASWGPRGSDLSQGRRERGSPGPIPSCSAVSTLGASAPSPRPWQCPPCSLQPDASQRLPWDPRGLTHSFTWVCASAPPPSLISPGDPSSAPPSISLQPLSAATGEDLAPGPVLRAPQRCFSGTGSPRQGPRAGAQGD